MKFKAKVKDYQLIVRVKMSFGETIDEKEIDRFSRIFLRGFLKPKVIKKSLVEYTGPIGVSLYDRLKKPITKRDFLFILEQVVVAVEKLEANHLPLNNLVAKLQYVYINEITKEVQFIYLPIIARVNKVDIAEFIEQIVYSLKPEETKDNDFVSRFIYHFKALKTFDIEKIEKFIVKEDRSVVNTIRKQNAGQSGFMTDKLQHYYERYEGKNDDEEKTGLLYEEATGLLDEEATGILEEEATGLLGDEEATGLLIENHAHVHYPSLYRVLTDETIIINKPVFRLGKEKSYVDYFVTNNIAVSRSHADIIRRGDRYFVKDLDSKNHTYINERELPIHTEVEIHGGDSLKLGNEEFVFQA